jgi:hypothetical protein
MLAGSAEVTFESMMVDAARRAGASRPPWLRLPLPKTKRSPAPAPTLATFVGPNPVIALMGSSGGSSGGAPAGVPVVLGDAPLPLILEKSSPKPGSHRVSLLVKPSLAAGGMRTRISP